MAKEAKEVTSGYLEGKLRNRAQSTLKARISAAAQPLRDMVGKTVGATPGRALLHRLESQLYHDMIDEAEKRELDEFIAANRARADLIREAKP